VGTTDSTAAFSSNTAHTTWSTGITWSSGSYHPGLDTADPSIAVTSHPAGSARPSIIAGNSDSHDSRVGSTNSSSSVSSYSTSPAGIVLSARLGGSHVRKGNSSN
jgi:hypothetical protein